MNQTYILIWENPPGTQNEHQIRGNTVIGRSEDADLTVSAHLISRKHAALTISENRLVLEDLNSANGTLLNGEKLVEPTPLFSGDEFQLGAVRFTLRVETIQEPVPAKPGTLVVPASSFPYLTFMHGQKGDRRIVINREKMSVGRNSRMQTWDINLPDRAVSRPQAFFFYENQQAYLEDQHSANGTLVNGELIQEKILLKNGDVIVFGETTLLFHSQSEPQA